MKCEVMCLNIAALTIICLMSVPGFSATDTHTTKTETQSEKAPSSSTKAIVPEPAPLFQMHYEARVRSYKEQNKVFQNVVLLGDSITEAFDVDKYLPGRRVLNRGIGGDVVGNNLPAADKRGLLKRLDSSIFDCSPTDVFILIGINDLGQGHTPEVIEAGYNDMLTQIRERLPKVKLHLQSVLPTSLKFAKHNANVLDLNQRIQKLATKFQCKYIDLHDKFADDNGELKHDLTKDGLHILPVAYESWVEIIETQLGWNS